MKSNDHQQADTSDSKVDRPARPREVVAALILLAITIVWAILALLPEIDRYDSGEISGLALAAGIVKTAIAIGLFVAIARGSSRACYLLMFIVGVSFIYFAGSLANLIPPTAQDYQWVYYGPRTILNLVPFVLDFVALYLLLFPGKPWFEAVSSR